MSNFNFANKDAGARIVDFSSAVDNCDPSNALDSANDMIWLSEKGLPQWLCVSLEDVEIKGDSIIRTVGWRCWHPYKTNPRVVKLHVSPDGAKFKAWDTFTASSQQGLMQLFCSAPISVVLYKYIAFEIIDTFGGDQTYINALYLFSDELSQSPLVSLFENGSSASSEQNHIIKADIYRQPDLDPDDEEVTHDGTISLSPNHFDSNSQNSSVDTGTLLSQLEHALGLTNDSTHSNSSKNVVQSPISEYNNTRARRPSDVVEYEDSELYLSGYDNYPTQFQDTVPELSELLGHGSGGSCDDDEKVHELGSMRAADEANVEYGAHSELYQVSITSSRASQVSNRLRKLEDQIGMLTDAFKTMAQQSTKNSISSRGKGNGRISDVDSNNVISMHDGIDNTGVSDSSSVLSEPSSTSPGIRITGHAAFQRKKEVVSSESSELLSNSVHEDGDIFTRIRNSFPQNNSELSDNSIEFCTALVIDKRQRIDTLGSNSLCTDYGLDHASPARITVRSEKQVGESKLPDSASRHRDHRYHMTPSTGKGITTTLCDAEEKAGSIPKQDNMDLGTLENDDVSCKVSDDTSIYEDTSPSVCDDFKLVVNDGSDSGSDFSGSLGASQFISSGISNKSDRDELVSNADALMDDNVDVDEADSEHHNYHLTQIACAQNTISEKKPTKPEDKMASSALKTDESVAVVSITEQKESSEVCSAPQSAKSRPTNSRTNGIDLYHKVENIEEMLQTVLQKLGENAEHLKNADLTLRLPNDNLNIETESQLKKTFMAVPSIEESGPSEPVVQPVIEDYILNHSATLKSNSSRIDKNVPDATRSSLESVSSSSAVRGHSERLQSLLKPGLVPYPRVVESPPRLGERHLASSAATQRSMMNISLSVPQRYTNSMPVNIGRRGIGKSRTTQEHFVDSDTDVSSAGDIARNGHGYITADRKCHRSQKAVGSVRDEQHIMEMHTTKRRHEYDDKHNPMSSLELREPAGSRYGVSMYSDSNELGRIRRSSSNHIKVLEHGYSRSHQRSKDHRSSTQTSMSIGSASSDVEIADIVRRLHAKILKRTLKEAELKALRDGSTLYKHLGVNS